MYVMKKEGGCELMGAIMFKWPKHVTLQKQKVRFGTMVFFSRCHMACASLPSSNVDGMKIVVITFSLNPKPITFRIWCSLFVFVYHLLMFLAWDDNATYICILVIEVFTWCTHQHFGAFVVAKFLFILGSMWRGSYYF